MKGDVVAAKFTHVEHSIADRRARLASAPDVQPAYCRPWKY